MTGVAELVALETIGADDLSEWRRLADRALEPNPFFDPDFVLPAAQALEANVQLLVVRGDGDWQACLPVTERRGWRAIPLPALVTWRHQYCFLGTPLVAGDDPGGALASLVERGLRETPTFLGLDLLGANGPVWPGLDEAWSRHGRPVELRRFERAALGGDTDSGTNLSRKHEREMRRLRSRLGDHLGAEIEVTDRSGDPSAYDTFLSLETAGWKGKEGTSLAAAGHGELFREICERFNSRGALRLLDLHSNGRTAAMVCDLTAGDTGYAFKIAFDEGLRKFGPGTQIMLSQIELLQEDPALNRLDSCAEPGHEMAERAWAGRRELAIVALPRPGVRGALSRAALRGVLGARRLLRR